MKEQNWRKNSRKFMENEQSEKYYKVHSSPRQIYNRLKREDRWSDIIGQFFIPMESAKFRKIFEKSHDAILILDDGRVVDANQSALTMFGCVSKSELIGCTPADISPDVQPCGKFSGDVSEEWIEAAKGGRYQHFPWQHLKKDGTLLETEVSLNRIEWDERILLVAFVRDRTESIKIERELQERMGYYNLVMNSLPVILYMANIKSPFNRSWVSDKIMTMSGYDPEVFQDESFWYSRIHTDDRDAVMNIFSECSTENVIMSEYRWQKANGEYMWLRDWAVIHRDHKSRKKEIVGVLLNINSQKKDQEKMRQNEAFLQSIIQNIPAMVFLKKAEDLSFVSMNTSGEELLGMNAEEIIGKNDLDLFPDVQAAGFVNTDQESIRKKKIVDIQMEKIMTASGDKFLHTRKIPLFDDKGQPEFLLGVSIDITEKQKMTNALIESEEKYRVLFGSLPVGIAITTIDGKILAANDTASSMFGYTSSELIGSVMANIYVKPGSRDEMLRILENEGKVSNFETLYRKRDGSLFPVSLNVIPYPLYSDGALLTVFNDITNKRKTEDKIRQLSSSVEQSPAAVIIMGLQGIIEYVNPRFTEITGYSSAESTGHDLNLLQPDNSPVQKLSSLFLSMQKGVSWKGTISSRRKSGELFWGEISVSPLKDNSGNVTHHIAVMEDITPRIKAENDLVRAKEKAEESDRLKTAFLSNISHEVRTPMNAIVGFSQLLKEQSLTPEKRNSFINMIVSKSDDLLRILDEIIDVSMIQSGQVKINYDEFWLDELFDELYTRFSCRVKPNVELVKNTPGAKGNHIVRSDYRRVRQIMECLIDNAIRYTDKGTITFGFKLHPYAETVTLYVRDTGIGIDAAQIPVIFKPFMQEDITDKQARGGKGVGLTISRKLAEMLGGEIHVYSRKGQGSSFFVELPVDSDVKDQEEQTVMQYNKPERNITYDWKGKTILIAEDDFSNFRYLELILQKTSASVIHCDNGEKVVEKIHEGARPEIILMDIRMPVMDGVRATEILRSEKYSGPVIALTAFSTPEEQRVYLSAGCNDVLSKPIDSAILLKRLNEFMKT